MNRLSHSQASKFNDCAKAWEFHYRQKLRPMYTSSALLFGGCLDKAVEVFLKTNDSGQAFDALKVQWEVQEINGKPENLFDSALIVYSNSDFDKDLLIDTEILDERYPHWRDEFPSIVKQKDVIGFKFLKKEQKQLLNAVNWVSMYQKGKLMLGKAIELITANVTKMHDTQVKVSLANDQGDEIVGYADMVVDWKGYDEPVVMDLKTSSIDYQPTSVLTSPQLSLYVHDLSDKFKTRSAGYLVLKKRLLKNKTKVCSVCGHDGSGKTHRTCPNEIDGKRCGGEWTETIKFDVDHQVIINKIPERTEEIVIENMDLVNESIKTGIFPRNFSACSKPWGLCQYADYCFHNKKDGLVEV